MLKKSTTAILMVLLSQGWAFSVETKFWTTATFEEFAEGNFSGLSLSREGAIRLAPELEEVFNTDQAMIWAVTHDTRGNLYLGTGHSGKVFRLGRDLDGSLFFNATEPTVLALATDKEGNVFVGTSPSGKVYKVNPNGNAQEFFDPQARYIWSLIFASDGLLYVGTGDRGRIYRVRPNGEGELFYDTQQRHVVSLAITPEDEVIAGTEPNGLLFRLSRSGKGFVLYQAPLAEIHQVAVAADGSIYATAIGTTEDRRIRPAAPTPPTQPIPRQSTAAITPQAAEGPSPLPGEGGGSEEGALPNPEQTPPLQLREASPQPPGLSAVQVSRPPGSQTPKGSLLRVWPDYTVETLWDSPRESAFDFLSLGENLLFSTDENGRIYELTPDRHVSLLAQTDQGQTTRLIRFEDSLLATTANLGKVFRLGKQPSAAGTYESQVQDAGNVAGWGTIRWSGEVPPGTSVEFFARSGNSPRPDATWSDWSGPYQHSSGEQIDAPPARYLQWKAELRSAAGLSPILSDVTVAYLPRNRAPELQEINIRPRGASTAAIPVSGRLTTSNPRQTQGSFSAGSASAVRQRGLDIQWTASEPDGDPLQYTLYFRGEEENEWKLLANKLQATFFPLDPDVLPDGKYRVKIVASDALANPPETARTAERVSAPFIVDSTPPEVEVLETRRTGASAVARFRAKDKTSPLIRAEYAIDAGPLVPLLSEDGIVDSQEEMFVISIDSLDDREYLLTLRVYDAAGNVGMAKTVWPAPSAQKRNGETDGPLASSREKPGIENIQPIRCKVL